jgi:hypothetical protein
MLLADKVKFFITHLKIVKKKNKQDFKNHQKYI